MLKKKILSWVLAVVVAITSMPIYSITSSAEATPTITINNSFGKIDSEVVVDVEINNNPGILGMTLELEYDENIGTLIDIKKGDALNYMTFTTPRDLSSGCSLPWDAEDYTAEDVKDGTLVTLTFKLSENIDLNEILNIKLSYNEGAIIDGNMKRIDMKINNGCIRVLDFTPGDLNDDGLVNTTDVVLLRRYIAGGYGITIREEAADVNDDGLVNTTDVVVIRRYIAGGYGVAPIPPTKRCNHTLVVTEEKESTCKEHGNIKYWQCTKCEKYYSDAKAKNEIAYEEVFKELSEYHTVVIDSAVEPTTTTTGLTEGSHCSTCLKVFKAQEIIPILVKNEYAITYYISNNDTYLAQVNIENKNPSSYTSEEGLVLKDLMVPGYNFKGWYTASTGGTRVSEIEVGTKGEKTLYAQWEKVEYTITFDSPDVPVDGITYTVDKGATLTNATWYGYTFVGWSTDDGFIVNRIKPGTIGNITLHANWTSNRNRATSYADYGEPVIIEDDTNGQFLFVYNIGRIENVPLSTIEYIGNTQSLSIDKTYEVVDYISDESAKKISNVVTQATTSSSAWTLSEEWNQIYHEGNEYGKNQVKTKVRTDSEGNVVGGNYFVSSSSGGASYISTESGGSSFASSKVTTDASVGINKSYDTNTESYCDAKLGVENKTEASAGISLPVDIAKVEAGVKNTTTIGAEVSNGRKDSESTHADSSYNAYVGTVNLDEESSYYNVSANQSSTWNSTTGYEQSYSTSRNSEVTNAIAEEISEKTVYDVTDSLSGANSTTNTTTGTSGQEDEYSNTFKYSSGTSEKTTKSVKFTSDRPGYYRLVTAGTVHVYAVVGYDVATSSYYTYTYNVLDDERHEYLDYSKDNANFDDCQNGVVAFEVPYDINEYIAGVTAKTDGLEYGLDGTITEFEIQEGFDGVVSIPQYYSVNNGDGTYSAYRTIGFSANVFKGNTEIETVILPMYVTEIPDNAFEGCTNLKTVIAYGVTKIGKDAFKGCSSLTKFSMDNLITELGENAFNGVKEIAIMAANANVADAAFNSGAKEITVNLSELTDCYDEKIIKISSETDYIAIISDGAAYKNLKVESDATETFISNIKFVNNADTVLKISSKKLQLNRVTVEESAGFALLLTNENTDLKLYGKVTLSSKNNNTVISKNVSLSKANAEVASTLCVDGNYYINGIVINDKYLDIANGELITITEEQYNNMLVSSIVMFDAHGGTCDEKSKVTYHEQSYGTLPVPTREHYTFDGWFTAAEGGTQVTADTLVTALVNHTLYAHWTKNTYKVTFNAGEGIIEEKSRLVACGEEIGKLPIPTLDYYTFKGWYTDLNGTTEVTSELVQSTAVDITIYALWEINATSDWVLVADMPSDAKVIDQKWTYDLTTNITSDKSYVDGYELYNTTSKWGSYGSWSAWQDGAVGGSDARQVETRSVWGYYYFRCNYCGARMHGWGTNACYTWAGGCGKSISESSGVVGWFTTSWNSAGLKDWHGTGKYYTYSLDGSLWFKWPNGSQKTQYRYRDRKLIYTYYHTKKETKESSTEITASSNISNIQKWVQYIPR